MLRRKTNGVSSSRRQGSTLASVANQTVDRRSFLRGSGLAIGGYDPVAYFTQGKPVKGKSAHKVMWKGAVWTFASAAHREAFEADPRRYAPQFGGYCAYAVSRGYTAKTDPKAWKVHEGRLYLNYSTQVRTLWSRDIPGNIALARGNWPGVLSK